MKKRLGIVVGGGPAPGINGVISSVTIEAINEGIEVIGIIEGFKWISQGDITHVKKMEIEEVSRIHYQGGSIIGTSRDYPIDTETKLANIIHSIKALKLNYLVSIGGDGTGYISFKLYEALKDKVKIAHVPKTVDNDLPLPEGMPTFGFETARQVGTDLVRNIMEDSKTTSRWYFIITMGRIAGHLALGIAKSSSATIAIIPEELDSFKNPSINILVDMLEASIIKRMAYGKNYGVAVIAEGVATKINLEGFDFPGYIERDDFGHLRLSEIPLGKILKDPVCKSLKSRGIDKRILDVEIGYVLRSAPPIAYDIEYTRNLGFGAIKFLLSGKSGAIIAFKGSRLSPIYFDDVLSKDKQSLQVRLVDLKSESYKVAQQYMIKLTKSDFKNEDKLSVLSRTANMSKKEFVDRFKYIAIED